MMVLVILIAFFAVARITRFVVEDQLGLFIRKWVIAKTGEDSRWTYLVHCPWCTSIWVALVTMPIAVLWPNKWILMALAVPAASMITGKLLDKGE